MTQKAKPRARRRSTHTLTSKDTPLGYKVMRIERLAKDARQLALSGDLSPEEKVEHLEHAYDLMQQFATECFLAHYYVLNKHLNLRGQNYQRQEKTEARLNLLQRVKQVHAENANCTTESLTATIMEEHKQLAKSLWGKSGNRLRKTVFNFVKIYRGEIWLND